jgi:aldose 1-epimerase
MKVKKQNYGTLSDGTKATLYTVSNAKMSFSVTDYGCTITSILLPDKVSGTVDVLLGFSTLDGYITGAGSYGALVGRFANRISAAKFDINGQEYDLDANSNGNCLHGGYTRFEKMLWNSKIISTKHGTGVRFTRLSHEKEQGFPGNMQIEVTYTLNDANEITLSYKAVSDKATPVNLTNHSYFNLAGNGSILDHTLQMNCSYYLDVDKELIPSGKLIPVKNTIFDFTTGKTIGTDIAKTGNGYDHCFVTQAYDAGAKTAFDFAVSGQLVQAAVLSDPVSGRKMSVKTNQEGVQVYTANSIEGTTGKNGRKYRAHEAICLETQCFPDSPNKQEFPSCILQPGSKYKALTVYGFSF